MKDMTFIFQSLTVFATAACMGLAILNAQGTSGSTQTPTNAEASQGQAKGNIGKQQSDAEKQARPDLEKQRQNAQQQGAQNLDKDAVAAIQETRKAIADIAANNTSAALAAIEHAIGKINVLTARNPSTALIPVALEVDIIDTAPSDNKRVLEIATDASRAMDELNFPAARVLLDQLRSESCENFSPAAGDISRRSQRGGTPAGSEEKPGSQQRPDDRLEHSRDR